MYNNAFAIIIILESYQQAYVIATDHFYLKLECLCIKDYCIIINNTCQLRRVLNQSAPDRYARVTDIFRKNSVKPI